MTAKEIRHFVFVLAACVCFAVAALVALGAFNSNEAAWADGGLFALAVSLLP